MLPNFLLIGPGRAGSTWITKNLMLHPEIYMPRRKVTRFFIDNYDKGLDWYKQIFGERTEKAVGEASVGYLHTEHAAPLIKEHMPNVKLIANLRDPVDRAYSSYGRLRGVAREGEINFDISFEEKIKITPRLLDAGLYCKHLKRWFDLFPRENFLILTFDEMKADPNEFLKKIYSFLDVDAEFESPLTNQMLNATATLSSKSKLLYYIYRVFLRVDLFKVSKALDHANQTRIEKINPETRKMLIEEFFLEDINALEKLIQRDFSHWKQ